MDLGIVVVGAYYVAVMVFLIWGGTKLFITIHELRKKDRE